MNEPPTAEVPAVTVAQIASSQLSTAVMLCLFRGCPWTSSDTRGVTREAADEEVARHLLAAHRDRLEYLWLVLESGA